MEFGVLPTMGHFTESSYDYLLFKNGTILTTITSITYIHKGKATTATINAKKTFTLFLPVTYKGEGISASRRARATVGKIALMADVLGRPDQSASRLISDW